MPALLERPKMTRTMYEALKRHIMNERAKIKQEQEQDALLERMRKEKEQQKKKEEEEALTLEQTKEQIAQLEKRLEDLRSDKHQLFLQLKKVLNQEEETRRRAQLKEQSEMLSLQQQSYPQHIGPSVLLQPSHMSSRPTLYKPVQVSLKRTRSPSPPASSSYQASYQSESKYSYTAPKAASLLYAQHNQPSDFKLGNYSMSQGGQTMYGSQTTAHYVQQSQQPAVTFQSGQGSSGKYTASQSAFASYPSPYTSHQTGKSDTFPPSYGLQTMPQPGYHSGQAGATLQHQLEQAQKSAFSEDYKQQANVRTITTSQPSPLITQSLMQPQQSKGSIVTGIPGQVSSSFLSSAPPNTYQNQAGSTGRQSYSTQSHHQYYQGH